MRYFLIILLAVSGISCCNWTKICRDDEGRITKVISKGNHITTVRKDGEEITHDTKKEPIKLFESIDMNALKTL